MDLWGSRVRSPSAVPVVLSLYQRGCLLDGLAMYLSCDTKKFHDNENTHILHNFWTSTHRGEAFPSPWRRHCFYPKALNPIGTSGAFVDCTTIVQTLWPGPVDPRDPWTSGLVGRQYDTICCTTWRAYSWCDLVSSSVGHV